VGAIHVRQTLQRVNGWLQLVPPKTARSRRTVPLPAVTLAVLREHRARMEAEAAARGAALSAADHGFMSAVGTPIEPRNMNRSFKRLTARARLRGVRLHDLRHTCASLLLAQGVPARVVMETLGHSAIAVTMNTYSHVLPSLQREAADRMNDLLA
jgi:integrase